MEVGHKKMEVDVDIISFISGMCPTRARVEGERGGGLRQRGVTVSPGRQRSEIRRLGKPEWDSIFVSFLISPTGVEHWSL